MALETLVILGSAQQKDLALSLAKNLSSQAWYSTQETAYALLAMAKMVEKNGGKSIDLAFTQNGKKTPVKTDKAIAQRTLAIAGFKNEISISNNQGNIVYTTVTLKGKLPVGNELPQQKKLRLNVVYKDVLGKTLDVGSLRQGIELEARITVYNTTDDTMQNLALSQIVPSGWEIINTAFVDGGDSNLGNADYIDVRDDRTNFYFDLNAKKSKTFKVKLNASYLGDYYLPGSQVEAMYDNTAYARNKGQWIKVVR